MFNQHTKFEVSTIACNEEMKGNAKCKSSRFEPPFGGIRGNAYDSSIARWKAHCRLPIKIKSNQIRFISGNIWPIKTTKKTTKTTKKDRQT